MEKKIKKEAFLTYYEEHLKKAGVDPDIIQKALDRVRGIDSPCITIGYRECSLMEKILERLPECNE